MRATLTETARKARMGSARATIRSVDDDHLMQQVKHADVYHSETPTDFERWQMVGMTSVPIAQQDDPNQKDKKPAADETGDWNHDQPTGPAAEALMLYLNGSRSHPIAMIDDRRVRPYGMSEGEGANYAPDGSEQMVLFKETGTYIVSLDGPSVKDPKSTKTRFASLRHVTKKMQTHKIEDKQASSTSTSPAPSTRDGTSGQQTQEKYKHEGDSVNTEVRCTAGKINFLTGDTVIGSHDKTASQWNFGGKQHIVTATDVHAVTTKQINLSGNLGIALTGPTTVNGTPVATADMLDERDVVIAALEARIAALEARLV